MLKQQKKIPNKSICFDCVNYAEKLRLTSDRSFTFIEGRQTFYDKPTSFEDDTFSKLDKEIPVFDIESVNSIIDRDIEELVKRSRAQSLIVLYHLTSLYFIINLSSPNVSWGKASDEIQNFKNRFSFVSNSLTTSSLILESPFTAFV